jgi:Leucine-rich repeat (LRR) protein
VAEACWARSIYEFEESRTAIPGGAKFMPWDLQPLNLMVVRMLGFPTSSELLLAWLRTHGRQFSDVNIEELYLNKSQLTSVPKEIGNLKQLKKLLLDCNKLSSVPRKQEISNN